MLTYFNNSNILFSDDNDGLSEGRNNLEISSEMSDQNRDASSTTTESMEEGYVYVMMYIMIIMYNE